MKLFGIALLLASSCDAFAPSANRVSRTLPLHAKTLEGWKIEGMLKPANNFILIRKAEDESETKEGILLAEKVRTYLSISLYGIWLYFVYCCQLLNVMFVMHAQAKIKKTEGIVIQVGPGTLHPDSGIPFPMPVEEGDGVIYGKYDGTEVTIDGETHSLIRDSDILVKFKGTLTEDSVEAVNEGVLVFVETKERETMGGLILGSSSSNAKRPSTGVVVKVGPGRMASSGELIPMNVEVGDQVKFMDFAGNEIKIGEKEYSVVKMPEILAKF